MDFALSEEQSMLLDGAERVLRDVYGFEHRRAVAESAEGCAPEIWRTFAELGWLALPFDERHGGLGGRQADIMLLMEAFGRALVLEPYLANILLAGRLIARFGDEAQIAEYLPPIIEGRARAAFAYAEPQARYDPADVATCAESAGSAYRLSGRKSAVLGAPGAALFVVLARSDGDRCERDGLSCFLVPADSPGLSLQPYRTLDGGRAGEMKLEDVRLSREQRLGPEGGALPAVEEVLDAACAALCAEATGLAEAAAEATRDYLSQRKQFGVPLVSFQALQHRLADMTIAVEELRSLSYAANLRVDEADDRERALAVSAAKAEVARRGHAVVAEAVQLHGGMGVSDELNIATYFKRMQAINALFGDRRHHLRRYARLSG